MMLQCPVMQPHIRIEKIRLTLRVTSVFVCHAPLVCDVTGPKLNMQANGCLHFKIKNKNK